MFKKTIIFFHYRVYLLKNDTHIYITPFKILLQTKNIVLPEKNLQFIFYRKIGRIIQRRLKYADCQSETFH